MTDIAFSARTGIPDDLDVLSLSRIISTDSMFTVSYEKYRHVHSIKCTIKIETITAYNLPLLLSGNNTGTFFMERH